MPRPKPVRPGSILSARRWNETKDRAYTGATPSGGFGLDMRTAPHGVSIAFTPTPGQKRNAIQCELVTAADAPLFGVAEMYETSAGYDGTPIGSCRRPSHYGFGWCGVFLESASENTVALVQTAGLTPVIYTGTAEIGGTLGCVKDSYYAAPHQGGPFLVRELPTAGIAIVEITGRRLDYKMVDCDAVDPSVSGPYHTIIYKGRAIAITSPGVTVTS